MRRSDTFDSSRMCLRRAGPGTLSLKGLGVGVTAGLLSEALMADTA
jgi:hypothetical protein